MTCRNCSGTSDPAHPDLCCICFGIAFGRSEHDAEHADPTFWKIASDAQWSATMAELNEPEQVYTPLSEADARRLSRLTQHYTYRDMITALAVDARMDGAHRLADELLAFADSWKQRGLGETRDADYMRSND